MKKSEGDILRIVLADQRIRKELDPELKSRDQRDPEEHVDARMTLRLNGKEHTFLVEVKHDVRDHMLPRLKEQMRAYREGLLVVARLTKAMRENLRQNGVNYLEANGNCSIRVQSAYVHIDGRPPLPRDREKTQRAFSKAGLRVIFSLLIDQWAIEAKLSELAVRSGTSTSNVSMVLRGLQNTGHLLEAGPPRKLVFADRESLIRKWSDGYEERLKPSLLRGRYRFIRESDRANWSKLNIHTEHTCWGGEAAGALLTKHLHPGELTLYTTQSRQDLILFYDMVPDDRGDVFVYERFWNYPEANRVRGLSCPPLLAYADLVHSRDSRCQEIAQRLFDERL